MVTYNHEYYIEQAVESVMSQQTDFSFKLFIGEDFSTDQTSKICIELKLKYGNKIELKQRASNLGAMENAMQMYNECFYSGAIYVAMLEGDDYWTDPLKLQKQVDFLKKNPDYVMTGGSVAMYDETLKTAIGTWFAGSKEKKFTLKESLQYGSGAATSSLMFRNIFHNRGLPTWFVDSPGGDWLLQAILLEHGDMYCFQETFGVFRRNHGSSARITVEGKLVDKPLLEVVSVSQRNSLKTIDYVDAHYKNRYSKLLDVQRFACYKALFRRLFAFGFFKEAKQVAKDALKIINVKIIISNLYYFFMILILLLPNSILTLGLASYKRLKR